MIALILYVMDFSLCQYLSRSANSSYIFEQNNQKKKQMQAVATYYPECNVIQLTMKDEKSFSPCKMVTPGSYVYIKCPSISTWQWHPFSVTPVSVFYETSIHFSLPSFFHLFPDHKPSKLHPAWLIYCLLADSVSSFSLFLAAVSLSLSPSLFLSISPWQSFFLPFAAHSLS